MHGRFESRSGVRGLLVDDNSDLLELMRELFVEGGFDVDALSNWTDAFDALTTNHYDFVIVDHDLGDDVITGPELVQKSMQKLVEAGQYGPHWFLQSGTGFDYIPASEQRILKRWHVKRVQKPFDPGTLLEMVAKALAEIHV